jgi:hypothetical protein
MRLHLSNSLRARNCERDHHGNGQKDGISERESAIRALSGSAAIEDHAFFKPTGSIHMGLSSSSFLSAAKRHNTSLLIYKLRGSNKASAPIDNLRFRLSKA